MAAQAGWYVDPRDERQYRYWDGERWTQSTQPIPGLADPAGAEPLGTLSSGGSREPAGSEAFDAGAQAVEAAGGVVDNDGPLADFMWTSGFGETPDDPVANAGPTVFSSSDPTPPTPPTPPVAAVPRVPETPTTDADRTVPAAPLSAGGFSPSTSTPASTGGSLFEPIDRDVTLPARGSVFGAAAVPEAPAVIQPEPAAAPVAPSAPPVPTPATPAAPAGRLFGPGADPALTGAQPTPSPFVVPPASDQAAGTGVSAFAPAAPSTPPSPFEPVVFTDAPGAFTDAPGSSREASGAFTDAPVAFTEVPGAFSDLPAASPETPTPVAPTPAPAPAPRRARRWRPGSKLDRWAVELEELDPSVVPGAIRGGTHPPAPGGPIHAGVSDAGAAPAGGPFSAPPSATSAFGSPDLGAFGESGSSGEPGSFGAAAAVGAAAGGALLSSGALAGDALANAAIGGEEQHDHRRMGASSNLGTGAGAPSVPGGPGQAGAPTGPESGGKAATAPAGAAKPTSKLPLLLGILAVVVLAAGAYLLFFSGDDAEVETADTTPTTVAAAATTTTAASSTTAAGSGDVPSTTAAGATTTVATGAPSSTLPAAEVAQLQAAFDTEATRACDVIKADPGLLTEKVIVFQEAWSQIPLSYEDLQRKVNECTFQARDEALKRVAAAEAANGG